MTFLVCQIDILCDASLIKIVMGNSEDINYEGHGVVDHFERSLTTGPECA